MRQNSGIAPQFRCAIYDWNLYDIAIEINEDR